ncbi:MAG: RagB/SusD family nutrient uptake outer membrane protein, partial [Paramuribaculum sp.]|nr:RagB/SusD family nutrient uptake outer membrane protein [Paramuribaculum sp.]
IEILTNFAKTRDPEYVYGTHNEAYNNTATSAFRNEIWWQRRVEFWGEGFSTLDVKRLQKGIIRSYPGTNHVDGYRWNTNEPPQWMTFCIVQTESNYNTALINNPTPVAPEGNSPEHTW